MLEEGSELYISPIWRAATQGRACFTATEEKMKDDVQEVGVGELRRHGVCVCVEIVAVLFYFQKAEALIFLSHNQFPEIIYF